MMRASVIRDQGGKHLVYQDVERPVLTDDQVLVKVGAVGICGSDLHGFLDPHSTARVPGLIMGHEAAGEVEEVQDHVKGLAVGDRVAIDPQVVCGVCDSCLRGWTTVCDNKKIIGSALRGFLHGAMADYIAVSAKQVYVLPDHVSLAEGALVEPLSNAFHVVNRVKFDLGSTVVVIGAGTLGLCLLQAAKLAGAGQVIVSDLSPFRLGLAKQLGATLTLHSNDSVVQAVMDATAGRGADVVIEAVGIETTYQQAIAMTRKRGSVMFFGAVTQQVALPLLPILHKELTLIGCTGAGTETQTAVDYLVAGLVDVKPIITHRYPLEAAQDAFDLLSVPGNQAVKVLLEP